MSTTYLTVAFGLLVTLVSFTEAVPPCTDPTRRVAICVQFSRPFSDNAFFWSRPPCAINPPSQSTLIGDNLEQFSSSAGCSPPFVATCCTSLGCGTAKDCDVETVPPVPQPAFLGSTNIWHNVVPCGIDVPSRVLENVITTNSPATTPFQCMDLCLSLAMPFAGVENGNECHCGTGFAGGVPPSAASVNECGTPCAGNYHTTCGGAWRIQIFSIR